MARRVLFLIHGIGQRAPAGAADKAAAAAKEWPKTAVELLVRLAQKYAPDVEVSLDPGTSGVRIVPLSYCELIVSQLEGWDDFGSSDVAGAFAARFPQLGAGRVGQLAGISAADAPFFWSAPVDVLFYRLFLDRDIRTHVREQIATALTESGSGATLPPCAFIAHSMGTAVLHDTLAELLARPDQFGGFANMDIHLYASISNVSKILQSVANPHASAVRPFGSIANASDLPRAGVRAFLNAHHVADPVAHVGMFRPKWDADRSFYLDVLVEKLKWVDVHGLIRYLENPQIHIPILRAALGATIDAATERAAIAEYDASPGDPCPMTLAALQDATRAIADAWDARGDAIGPVEFATVLVEAYKAFAAARAACAGGLGGIA